MPGKSARKSTRGARDRGAPLNQDLAQAHRQLSHMICNEAPRASPRRGTAWVAWLRKLFRSG